jgi:hypothetical protein
MKKQVMANQHMQTSTPHWDGDIWYFSKKANRLGLVVAGGSRGVVGSESLGEDFSVCGGLEGGKGKSLSEGLVGSEAGD